MKKFIYTIISLLLFHFEKKLENEEVGNLDRNSFDEETLMEDVNEHDIDKSHLEEDEKFDEREENFDDLRYDENMDEKDAELIERLYEDEDIDEYDTTMNERQYDNEKLGETEAWDYDEEEEDEYDELDQNKRGDYQI